MIVGIGHVGVDDVAYGCPLVPTQKPDLRVGWEGQARPPSNVMAVISKGSEFLTGATRTELTKETLECVASALKPDASELAERQVRGVKIECQAFKRDGGGGYVTIYRRFGPVPVLPEISAKATIAADQPSGEIKAEEARKAAEVAGAAEWPPDDPADYTTPTDFTVAWAKKLQGFRTLADLQRAAGSKGTISERKLDDDHPHVSFHWRSQPKNGHRIGYMLATVYSDGGIGVGVLTDENIDLIINNFGAFVCDKCDPPIDIRGAEPSWSK